MTDYTPIIQQAAREWNVDPTLLQAIIEQESGNNPAAVSKAGAVGLTGLMPETAKTLGVADINDPVQQIYGGAKYLAQALDASKSPEEALLYYHGGPNWQQSYGQESAAYVPAITARRQRIVQASAPAAATSGATSLDARASDVTASTTGPFTAAWNAAQPAAGETSGQPATESAGPFTQAWTAAEKAASTPQPTTAAATPPADTMWNEYGITGDPSKDNAPQGPESTIDLSGAAKGAASGAVAGFKDRYGDAPPGLSSDTRTALANSGLINKPGENNPLKAANEYLIVNPLSEGARVLSGLVGAYQGAAAGAGEGSGNQAVQRFGRELAGLPEAFPTLDFGGGTAIPRGPVGEPAPSNPLQSAAKAVFDQRDADLAARTPVLPPRNPLAATVDAPAFVPPGSQVPTPQFKSVEDVVNALRALPDAPPRPDFVPPGLPRPETPAASAPRTVPPALSPEPAAAPKPQSVGAAASRDLSPPGAIDMTPAQVQAYRSTAEGQKLLEPQQPGIADPNVYVPGVTPNQAEIEQSVNTARELKALNVQAPEVSQEAKEIAAANNDARQKFFSGIAGSDVDVQNAVAARAAQAEKDLQTAFGNKQPADAQPVVDTINGILKNPRDSENTAVQQYVKPLLDRLKNPDGSLKSDPEQLYGIREDIARMQSKAAKAETPTLDHVNGQLQEIKAALDGVIEQGAPGYKQYLQNFSEASRPIDTMQALQSFENKLYDSQNRMSYNRVQQMMRQIVDSRAAPGLNPFKSIPDETMQKLWNLRDDLRRSASAQELARTPGSDTTQTMLDTLKGVGKTGANLAVHGAIMSKLGPLGNFAYNGAKKVISAGAERRAAARQTKRGLQILHPDPSQLRNPLQSDQ